MKKDKLIEKQKELIDVLSAYSTQVAIMWNKDLEDDESKDLKLRLWEEVKRVKSEIASLESELTPEPEEICKALAGEKIEDVQTVSSTDYSPTNPQMMAEAKINSQIDDIEREDYLNAIFNDLESNAYDLDFHGYHYKQANQIVRKHFEKFASQFQKPTDELRKELIKAFDWLTRKDSPYAILYGDSDLRFAATDEDFTIEEVIDNYLKTK